MAAAGRLTMTDQKMMDHFRPSESLVNDCKRAPKNVPADSSEVMTACVCESSAQTPSAPREPPICCTKSGCVSARRLE